MGQIKCRCGNVLDDEFEGVLIHAYTDEHFVEILESDNPTYRLSEDIEIWRCPKCKRMYVWEVGVNQCGKAIIYEPDDVNKND